MANTDKERLDWLERKAVRVDTLLRHGSLHVFDCEPDLEDPGSALRVMIDLAMEREAKTPHPKSDGRDG